MQIVAQTSQLTVKCKSSLVTIALFTCRMALYMVGPRVFGQGRGSCETLTIMRCGLGEVVDQWMIIGLKRLEKYGSPLTVSDAIKRLLRHSFMRKLNCSILDRVLGLGFSIWWGLEISDNVIIGMWCLCDGLFARLCPVFWWWLVWCILMILSNLDLIPSQSWKQAAKTLLSTLM